jgi:hypothetical protein
MTAYSPFIHDSEFSDGGGGAITDRAAALSFVIEAVGAHTRGASYLGALATSGR